MAQSFAPGLHRAGTAGHVEPYQNTRRSVVEIAQEARLARHDPDLRAWAIDALAAAGFDGRSRTGTIREKVQAILDALRGVTTYVPDPAGTEWIQKPHVTLCLRNLCIRGGDCDDLLLCLVALCLTVGIPAQLVKQEFASGAQEHILMGVVDENGTKLYADPANTTAPVYSGSRAAREWWVNPLDQVGETGSSGNDFVTLGGLPQGSPGVGGHSTLGPRGRVEAMRGIVNPQLAPRRKGISPGLGLVSVADMDQWDAQIQAQVTALQDAVNSCSSLAQSDKDAFAGFVAAWNLLHQQWQGAKTYAIQWWNPGGAIVEVVALQIGTLANDMQGYVTKVSAWWAYLNTKGCNVTAPPGVVSPQPVPQAESPAGQAADAIASAAKAVGTLIIVGVVGYGVYKGVQVVAPWIAKKTAR